MTLIGTTWYRKQHDSLEKLREYLKGSDGQPITNLNSASEIHFHLWRQDTGEVVLNDSNVNVFDNNLAGVEYQFPLDPDERPGTYVREWHIIWGAGIEQRVPNGKQPYLVEVTEAGALA